MKAARNSTRDTAPVAPSSQTVVTNVEVGVEGRDSLRLHVEVDGGGTILASRLSGVGCSELLKILAEYRTKLTGILKDVSLPSGADHASMLMRELLLKARGEWSFPYAEEELCHCRKVSAAKVDHAVIAGCHTVAAVSRATSAGTSCGNCRADIEKVLRYRLLK